MRELSIVVWGPTGITGSKVCRVIATTYQGQVSWGLAGRSLERLEQLRNELASLNPDCKNLPLIKADINDKDSLNEMVKRADVIVACAGPYNKYSDAVVEACMREGTHFLDVTAEFVWVKSLIERFDEEAKKKNIKIVSFCGLNSVPDDVGCYVVAEYARKRYGCGVSKILGCAEIRAKNKMPLSGGSMATQLDYVDMGKEVQKASYDPLYLCPADKKPSKSKSRLGFYDKDFKLWRTPFVAEFINAKVVMRSNYLREVPYGDDFKFNECVASKTVLGWIGQWLQVFVFYIICTPTLSRFFIRMGVFPKPGQGPSFEDEKGSSWKVTYCGLLESDAKGQENKPIVVKAIVGDNTGVYTSTARLFVECVMSQVMESKRLDELGCRLGVF